VELQFGYTERAAVCMLVTSYGRQVTGVPRIRRIRLILRVDAREYRAVPFGMVSRVPPIPDENFRVAETPGRFD